MQLKKKKIQRMSFQQYSSQFKHISNCKPTFNILSKLNFLINSTKT